MRIILNTMCEFHSKSLKALYDLEDECIRHSNLFILSLFKNLIFLLSDQINVQQICFFVYVLGIQMPGLFRER